MASLFILYLLLAVIAFVLLSRHYTSVYYSFDRAVFNILGPGPAPPATTDTAPPTRYFRISDIPKTWSKECLVKAIKEKDLGFDEKTVKVSLNPSCNGTKQTALLHLSERSELVQSLQPEKTAYFTISSEGDHATVSIDSHFYNLTPLNTPGNRIIADVVAVNGLAGHAFESWKSDETGIMWLKDLLPDDVGGIRIMTYGYNTNLIGETVEDGFVDYTRHFIQILENSRQLPEEARRPIIFIGHSTGGILILQTLLQSKQGSLHKSIYDSTRAILFFGTPHLGLEIEGLLKVVKDGSHGDNSRVGFIKQLQEHDNFICTQREDIINLWGPQSDIRIFSFYETKTTQDLEKSSRGEYIEGIKLGVAVKKAAAQLFLPYEDRIPVGRTHSDLIKYPLAADATYQTVVRQICQCRDNIVKKYQQASVKLSQEHLDCIHSLKCYDCETYRQRLLKKRSGKTCSWIFEHHHYRKWIRNDDSSVIWISGAPGFGKSVLSSVVSDRLEWDRPITLENNYLVAYFFFDDKDEQLKGVPAMLGNVLGQLLTQDPDLLKHFFTQDTPRDKTNCKWSPEIHKRVFERIIQSDNGRKIFLVVDALDECDNTSLESFLKSIQHMRLHIPFIGQRMKILFTSRPHTPVRLNIPDVVEIDLSSKSRYSEKDITEYVRDGISKLDDLKLPIELRDEIEKVLIEGANGMFLWVFLILDDLRNSKQTIREAIQDKLKTLPKGLPKLYRNILTKIEPGDVEIAKTILQWVVWATRPLHVRELAVAIAIRPEHTSISSMQEEIDFSLERQIRRIFGPLIKIEDRTVHLIHQSAKDFLCDPEEINETLLHCPTGAVSSSDESNLQIASSCLVVLAFDDIKDCTKPKDRCDLDMWNIDKREQDPWALDQQSVDQFQRTMHNQFGTRIIAYALQNWIDHVMRLSEESRMCSRLIELFGKVAKYPHKIYLAYSGDMVHHGIPSQSSPLEIEAFLGHNGFVNILIDLVSTRKGAAQNARCMIYGEALHNAALAGSYEIVRELLSRGADVFGYGREYGTALTAAAMCGHEQIVRLLIDKGAGVNACGEDRGCPLLGAAATGRESIVRLLIDSGADVDAVNIDFGSPLLAAADHGHESVVRLLINNGADVNPVILGDYSSPLRTASQRGHHSIVRLLINSGADWDIC